MSFLKSTFNLLTDKRDINEPIIHKDFNEKSNHIRGLEELLERKEPTVNLKKVKEHLKLFEIGQTGEKSVLFELQNSMLPLVILHDVNIEIDGYEAQLDFVVITHKFILVLEVKKLFGNVKVTDQGEFQRIITRKNKVVNKEGMYSPINQAERQAAILEKFLKSQGIIKKCPIRSAVTFANPKTILEVSKKAPKSIQSRVIRHDQIRSFLTSEMEKESPVYLLDHKLLNISEVIVENCTEKVFNEDIYLSDQKEDVQEKIASEKTDEELIKSLKEFRLKRSRELDVKAFYIFTNKTLDSLVENRPQTIKELLEIEGIGPKKAEEFGVDILEVIKN